MASATIYETQWRDRYITFNVEISGTTANWTLTVAGDAGKWYATGATTCKIGNTTVYSRARSTSGFPAVVGTQSGHITVTAGQSYECSLETAIYTSNKTKKTFTVTAQGGGGGSTAAKAATITATNGQIGAQSSFTLQAYDVDEGFTPDYLCNVFIRSNGGARIQIANQISLNNDERKIVNYTIPTNLMLSLGDSSTQGTAELECVTYANSEDEQYEYELVGSSYCNITVLIPKQTLTITTLQISVYDPPEYTTEKEYKFGDLVKYNNIIYICRATTSGAWDSSKWTAYSLPSLALANRTLFRVHWSGAAASLGSYISKVKIEYARLTEEAENPATDGDYITGVVPASGNVEFKVTVTDARGFTGAKTTSISLLAYEKPQISEFIGTRWNGTVADDKGTQVYAGGTFGITDLDGYNHIENAKISNAIAVRTSTYYDVPVGEETYGVASGAFYSFQYWNGSAYSAFDINTSYYVKLSVTDTLNMTSEKIILISTEPAIMDFLYNGKGMAIGKVAETDNLLDIAMDIEANNEASQFSVKGNAIWAGTAGGASAPGSDGLVINTQQGTIQVKSDTAPMLYKQVRNIFISENEPTPSDGANGDIWIKVGVSNG